ncbi:MAG TPA: TRAP transporter large permease, partial [Burkholderiaceae bacterium]|nr:TRAP transporter large permease [Burkholderiaceae bacterium]
LKLFETSEHYTLLSIPFFILGGTFMTTGGVAKRMIRFANACIGHLRGGLAMASVMACMLFAAVSGSSPATVVAVGSIVIAGMVRTGYPMPFAAGVICNAGTLGILIPPSIVMVVYGAATETSVGKLFMAGVIPGILLGLMLMVAIYVRARAIKLQTQQRAPLSEVLRSGRDSLWGLLLIVIILGGIYGGVFTPTEAAAVAAVYAFVIAVFVYRDIGMKDVPRVLRDAAKVTVMLMFIVANALLFAHVLTTERIPQQIAEAIVGSGMTAWQFLLVVNLLLLIAGMFMEPTGIILILAPILFPIATRLGIDPVHLGIIMTVNLEIGMVTPPVGLNLFVTTGITGMSIMQVARAALPWTAVLLVFLAIVTYVPSISLVLPNALF